MSSNVPSSSPVKSTDLHVGAIKPGVAKKDPVLVADGVRRQFGGLVAVDVEHVDIALEEIDAVQHVEFGAFDIEAQVIDAFNAVAL